MIELPEWAKIARQIKEQSVASFDHGAMPPVVMAERDGEILAIAIAPQVNKHLGFAAARVLRAGFDADHIIGCFDMLCAQIDAKGLTEEEWIKKYKRQWPAGSMQRFREETGEYDLGLVRDTINSIRVNREGVTHSISTPYRHYGKGTAFSWIDDAADDLNTYKEFQGDVPDALVAAMQLRPQTDDPEFRLNAPQVMGTDRERWRFFTSRTAIFALVEKDFEVIDRITHKHPEWTRPERARRPKRPPRPR
jgi:hypothetical protein